MHGYSFREETSSAPHLYQPGAELVINHDVIAVHLTTVAIVDDDVLHALQTCDDGTLDPPKAPIRILESVPRDQPHLQGTCAELIMSKLPAHSAFAYGCCDVPLMLLLLLMMIMMSL